MQQQPQQMMNYIGGGGGGGGSLRHPSATPNMATMPAINLVHRQNMMAQQQGMVQMRPRHMIHGPTVMSGHPQQAMGMHQHHMTVNRSQMNPGMGMGGSMMQTAHGGMPMHQNIHLTAYNPRTGMVQHTMVPKPGMPVHPHRMQTHQMHPAMHTQGMPSVRQQMQGNPVMAHQHHYQVDPSGYQGHSVMRSNYMPAGQSAAVLPPHSHPAASSQMLHQQQPPQAMLPPASNAAPLTVSPQNMPSQQQPRSASDGVGQGSPLSGQLAGPQLQVATPPQQQQGTPPQQPAQGVTPLTVSYIQPDVDVIFLQGKINLHNDECCNQNYSHARKSHIGSPFYLSPCFESICSFTKNMIIH